MCRKSDGTSNDVRGMEHPLAKKAESISPDGRSPTCTAKFVLSQDSTIDPPVTGRLISKERLMEEAGEDRNSFFYYYFY